MDWVRVCVRRESPGIFSGLAGLNFIYVSAAATARVGPVGSIANVMPWGLVPPDGSCSTTDGDPCKSDTDGDGIGDTPCGYFPPIPEGEKMCPWGLDEDKLFVFKPGDYSEDDPYTLGNFGPISACGLGAVEYGNCIEGELATGFFAEGETVNSATQPGDLGAVTPLAMVERYAGEAPGYACDVASTPDRVTGLDPYGKRRAAARYVEDREPWIDDDPSSGTFGITYDFFTGCDFRLVSIPILNSFPPQGASEDILVLGVATFAIADWDRQAAFGNAVGNSGYDCDDPPPGPPPDPGEYFDCGYIWGYLIADAFPPNVLVNSISDSANPFAPLLIAMVE